jgi:Family of unknown function (DUF6760)
VSGGDELFDELAYVAYHLGWSLDAVLDLERRDRRRFADAIDRLNARAEGRV